MTQQCYNLEISYFRPSRSPPKNTGFVYRDKGAWLSATLQSEPVWARFRLKVHSYNKEYTVTEFGLISFFPASILQDEKYWQRRKKNNVAAKRSRDARRLKENQITVRAAFLERENAALRTEVAELRKECGRYKNVVGRYENKYGPL